VALSTHSIWALDVPQRLAAYTTAADLANKARLQVWETACLLYGLPFHSLHDNMESICPCDGLTLMKSFSLGFVAESDGPAAREPRGRG